LAVQPGAFRAAPAGASIASTGRAVGATVSYTDSEAATSTFSVLRIVPGTMKGSACVPRARRSRRHAHRCSAQVQSGGFTHADTSGANRFHFTGRVAGGALRPGMYVLSDVATNAGGASRAATATFRIVR
jgi:hypothetical protein